VLALLLALTLQSAPAQSAARDTVRGSADSTADSTRTRAQRLESVRVTAIRGHDAPISQKTISRGDLMRQYTGQEMPILLQDAPGITAYAESGSGSNYSYMRMRGIDQTRINITLDGIPLNEPEDESLYFSNFPDFASSIASVQVQRGVGASTPGVASYAGSVNFESIPIAGVSRGGELALTRGAFNTSRAALIAQSGLTASAFASGGWFGARDVVKATLLAGISSNEQAYLASPLSVLQRDTRDNPFGNSPSLAVEDRFHQDLLSLAWTHALAPTLSVASTAYGFDAGGWYDYPTGNGDLSDAYHYGLHSRWGGVISSLDWSSDRASASAGVNVSRYAREHWMGQRPDMVTRYYDNTGYKGEQSAFAKGSVTRGRTTLYGDLQLRFAQFRYAPTAGSGVAPADVSWSFLNPKAGVRVRMSDALSMYASAGLNGREPTRTDIFAGADDVDSVTAHSVYPLTRVHPESARDLEAGLDWTRSALQAHLNFFLMQFHNEIAPIGQISELGYELRKNVARSVRRGAEGDFTWRALPRLTLVATASLTDARIADYTDDASGVSYHDVTSLMTPKFVSGHGVRAALTDWVSLDLDGRYTSRMMLTNTNDPRFVVPASWYADGALTFHVGQQLVLLAVRNLLDARVYTGGYPGPLAGSSDPAAMEPYYYTLASR
jgi:iron complex outermembrane receptor protein